MSVLITLCIILIANDSIIKFLAIEGEPNAPVVGGLMSGPSAGQVTITVKTTISGIRKSSQELHFIVTPILDGTEEESRKYFFPDYQNGTFVTIVIEELRPGRNYQFSVSAATVFEESFPTLSTEISAGTGLCVLASNCVSPLMSLINNYL